MNIVVLTSESSPYAPMMLAPVLERFSKHIGAVVTVSENARNGRISKLRRVAACAGWRYALLKGLYYSALNVHQWAGRLPDLDSICRRLDIRRISLRSMKDATSKDVLIESKPDLLLSVLFEKIIPRDIIELPPAGAFNVHPALLPQFGGIAPVFWVLSKGEHQTGVTLHSLDEGIDTGEIVFQHRLPVSPDDTVHTLYVRCCRVASGLLIELITDALEHRPSVSYPQSGERSYFREPTRHGYDALVKAGHSLFSVRDLLTPNRGNA